MSGWTNVLNVFVSLYLHAHTCSHIQAGLPSLLLFVYLSCFVLWFAVPNLKKKFKKNFLPGELPCYQLESFSLHIHFQCDPPRSVTVINLANIELRLRLVRPLEVEPRATFRSLQPASCYRCQSCVSISHKAPSYRRTLPALPAAPDLL